MPQDLVDMRKELVDMLGGPAAVPGYQICPPIYKILRLRYYIRQGTVIDLDEMLDKFNEAEDDFETAISLFPDNWQYSKYRLTPRPRPGFFNNVCHVYPDLSAAQIWNGARTCRMLILETMLEELHRRFLRVPVDRVPARYQFESYKARFKLEKIALAILASVPQHFGLVSPSDASLDTLAPMPNTEDISIRIPESEWEASLGESDSSDFGSPCSEDDEEFGCRSPSLSNPMQARGAEAQEERLMLLASVASSLVWPLYLVGMSTASSPSIKAYVIERLRALHTELGITQAKKLAEFVESHQYSGETSGYRSSVGLRYQ